MARRQVRRRRRRRNGSRYPRYRRPVSVRDTDTVFFDLPDDEASSTKRWMTRKPLRSRMASPRGPSGLGAVPSTSCRTAKLQCRAGNLEVMLRCRIRRDLGQVDPAAVSGEAETWYYDGVEHAGARLRHSQPGAPRRRERPHQVRRDRRCQVHRVPRLQRAGRDGRFGELGERSRGCHCTHDFGSYRRCARDRRLDGKTVLRCPVIRAMFRSRCWSGRKAP